MAKKKKIILRPTGSKAQRKKDQGDQRRKAPYFDMYISLEIINQRCCVRVNGCGLKF